MRRWILTKWIEGLINKSNACVHACNHAWMHVCMCVCMDACMCARLPVHACWRARCKHVCAGACVHICTHASIYGCKLVDEQIKRWTDGIDEWMNGGMCHSMRACMDAYMKAPMDVWHAPACACIISAGACICIHVWMYGCMDFWTYVWIHAWTCACMVAGMSWVS